jgi:hypothetical protein
VCVRIFALVMRQANRIFSAPYYTVIYDLSGFTVFSMLSLQQDDVRNNVIEQKKNALGYHYKENSAKHSHESIYVMLSTH